MNNTLHSNTDDVIPLLPYYVYVLIDPRDNSVFYVGKGQGNRAHAHIQEHDRLDKNGETLDAPKMLRINQIKTEGATPIVIVVGRFESEDEAYAVEATLIKWVYGFDELTNKVEGHGSTFIRPKGHLGTLPSIDIPASERTKDGSFRDAKVAALSAAGAFDLQESLKSRLIDAGFNVRDFSAKEDKSFDPGTSNGWLGLLVRIGHADFCVMFSKTCKPAILVANTAKSRTEDAKAQFQRIEAAMGQQFKLLEPVNSARYRFFATRVKLERWDIEGTIRLLQDLQTANS